MAANMQELERVIGELRQQLEQALTEQQTRLSQQEEELLRLGPPIPVTPSEAFGPRTPPELLVIPGTPESV